MELFLGFAERAVAGGLAHEAQINVAGVQRGLPGPVMAAIPVAAEPSIGNGAEGAP
ncbi:MAG TPA: hypothetical protein VHA79_11130 [Mycobacteriales bacterium]|nr:hypothetical protein [Mycobacteriales bacterium]